MCNIPSKVCCMVYHTSNRSFAIRMNMNMNRTHNNSNCRILNPNNDCIWIALLLAMRMLTIIFMFMLVALNTLCYHSYSYYHEHTRSLTLALNIILTCTLTLTFILTSNFISMSIFISVSILMHSNIHNGNDNHTLKLNVCSNNHDINDEHNNEGNNEPPLPIGQHPVRPFPRGGGGRRPAEGRKQCWGRLGAGTQSQERKFSGDNRVQTAPPAHGGLRPVSPSVQIPACPARKSGVGPKSRGDSSEPAPSPRGAVRGRPAPRCRRRPPRMPRSAPQHARRSARPGRG